MEQRQAETARERDRERKLSEPMTFNAAYELSSHIIHTHSITHTHWLVKQ